MSLEVSTLRALAHPLRLQILSLLTGAEMSAAELARELGTTQANASYHLRTLAAAGQVVEAGTEQIRGGTAKRYRYPADREPASSSSAVDGEAFVLYLQALAGEMVRRGALRRPEPGSSNTTDAELWVRPEVWAEVRGQVERASRLLHQQAQPPRTEGTLRVTMTSALFVMTEPRDEPS